MRRIRKKLHNLALDRNFSEILIGSAWALSARVAATGMGLVSSIIIARIYGAEVVGIVAVLNSFLMLATILTVLGTDTSLLRLIPEHLVKFSTSSAFQIYRKTQWMVILVSLVAGGLFFLCAEIIADKIFSKPHFASYFALASVFVVFKSLEKLNTNAVRGLRLIKAFAFMQMLPQGSSLLILILLGLFWPGPEVPVYSLFGGLAVTGVIGWLLMTYSFQKKCKPGEQIDSLPFKKILFVSLPMLMSTTMSFLIGQTGVILLGMFRSESEVGYFAIAVKLATLTTFVLQAVNAIAGPKFSELYHSNNMDELFLVAKKSAKLIFWTTVPILLGFVISGKLILSIAFGQEFAVAYPALIFLILGQFVNSISGSTAVFMNMTGNQKIFRNIVFVAVIVNISINLLLTPYYGIGGAAIAAAVSIACWNIFTLFYIKQKFGHVIGYFPGIF